MELFRAIPAKSYAANRHMRLETRRLPSNVPYLIDNLWEYLRPAGKPSRRHAVYASPSVELATANASAATDDGYAVYRLVFERPPAFMQLSVTDARHHPDIKALQRIVHALLGVDFGSWFVDYKLPVAALFLPGVTKTELERAASESEVVRDILARAAEVSTFWTGGDTLDPASNGELFFELEGDNSYTLQPL